nr:MAG TPA: light-independent protochlorophyllide reductase subunit N [Caudoviricetes sp.]
MNKKRSIRSQRFYRWSHPLFVPTKTIKSPNFTLRNKRKSGCAYIATILSFNHIQDNI